MLVLSRQPGERIIIGDAGSEIAITAIRMLPSGELQLGIQADRSVTVLREELFKQQRGECRFENPTKQ